MKHNLEYVKTNNLSDLRDFFCGVDEMDRFIHASLQNKIVENPHLANFIVKEEGIIVAICTIADKRLVLPDGKYLNTIEIEYLAVRHTEQNKGIGRQIIDYLLENIAPTVPDATHLTVHAYISDVYSAVPFYEKCKFRQIQKKHPMAETVRMARAIKLKG